MNFTVGDYKISIRNGKSLTRPGLRKKLSPASCISGQKFTFQSFSALSALSQHTK